MQEFHIATKQPPLRRRWQQFRLHTVFVLTTVIALVCGWFAHLHYQERAARASVNALAAFDDVDVSRFSTMHSEHFHVTLYEPVADARILRHLNNLPPNTTVWADDDDEVRRLRQLLPWLTVKRHFNVEIDE